jgi:PHD/YefM family antitoxin component YafN of YafNO toxin-antitoxin module
LTFGFLSGKIVVIKFTFCLAEEEAMLELSRILQTASMQDIKNRTGAVTKKFVRGPVLLMNRATPQAVLIAPAQWNAIVDRLEEMEEALITLQAELALAKGQSQVETIDDPAAFMSEVMGVDEPVSA